ncbi:acetone carboxylase gamma subunit [Rhodovulum sulfidophilum]|uniref:acetone carboxylase subunit gamma n=1 Tax=Rhodovulum sulfidophilum TaxID=35806 RepID=UPI0005A95634|nr:acetone carboxylase subunit gamma [Rhodovulum sulfidophilum]ANB34497.1 acetone carboxylase subunit gamma [Rhodovulum sulfidophilum DSM 1374]ANB38319.1 acetone carboxylase subunit gamma [Rhodovulum sulfidophilum]MCW2303675.1 acetone carboxylase gamma subunit [Rhodovulum sulfidophilum]
MAYTEAKIRDLVDGTIDQDTLHQMLSMPKDRERFEIYLKILQDQVPWDDQIILPLGPKLFIVQRAEDRKWVIRSWAGHDFCDWTENWKLHARVRVRDTPEAMEKIYPKLMAPSTEWQVIREYFCPLSGDLLDVEAPTPWYPVIHDFEPDIDSFYRDWLGLEVPERA